MVSLVVATRGRVDELNRLLVSLEAQSYTDFEVIVVDQNGDNCLQEVLAQHRHLPIRHLTSSVGASRARNEGIRAARGAIIGFPDDDCWYPPTVLEYVVHWFTEHRDFEGLFGVLRDAANRLTGPKWPQTGCLADRITIWKFGITPVAFLTRRATKVIGFFNENLGPGVASGYHSGEDSDYFLRSIPHDLKFWHEPVLVIHHPDFHDETRLREKSYSYALGGGYIFRAYGFPRRQALNVLVRSVGGAVVHLLAGRLSRSRSYFKRGLGFARGYMRGPDEVKGAE
jgi:glycosyltransferase involved in cell wall biosynthesis